MKYDKKQLAKLVKKNISYAGVIRELGLAPSGSTQATLRGLIKGYGVDISHFKGQGHRKGLKLGSKYPPEYYLQKRSPGSAKRSTPFLRRAMLEGGIPYLCKLCGQEPTWQGKDLVLEIDHINGDTLDNQKKNLRFLCPNCHSQTPTFRFKNSRFKRNL